VIAKTTRLCAAKRRSGTISRALASVTVSIGSGEASKKFDQDRYLA
jgi:hypothetical protein